VLEGEEEEEEEEEEEGGRVEVRLELERGSVRVLLGAGDGGADPAACA